MRHVMTIAYVTTVRAMCHALSMGIGHRRRRVQIERRRVGSVGDSATGDGLVASVLGRSMPSAPRVAPCVFPFPRVVFPVYFPTCRGSTGAAAAVRDQPGMRCVGFSQKRPCTDACVGYYAAPADRL